MSQRIVPELLSPAGGWPQLKAAVQNGADAVYLGGPLFNARIKADNFTCQDMAQAIDYAHQRNVKVYVTLNTLIKDGELSDAFSYVCSLYKEGADAVILQDMGLARLVKKYLPHLPIHLSTQGTVYNRWALALAKELGFSRIVPARELTLEELEAFVAESHRKPAPSQVEVFVHGALCMCYSGQCQMSRVLGGGSGRSGNRGLCAQPCRLPYKSADGETSYFLSPKDLCALELIPQLCRAGVDAFKIEGRLKSPQYVAVVTAVYRKYLDRYAAGKWDKVEAEDRRRLLQIFNRGGFTTGYLQGNPREKILSGASPKNQGVYIGRITGTRPGSTLIDVDAKEALSIGDGIEVHGRETVGNVLSYCKPLAKGGLRVGDIRGKVRPGDPVFKVTDKKLLREAESSYEGERRKISVDMIFSGEIGKLPSLTIKEGPLCVAIEGESLVEQARNKGLEPERIKKQLSKLGDTPFAAAEITVELERGGTLPLSVINRMRRQCVDKLLKAKNEIHRTPLDQGQIRKICEREELGRSMELLSSPPNGSGGILYLYSRKTVEAFFPKEKNQTGKPLPEEVERVCIPLELYMERPADAWQPSKTTAEGCRPPRQREDEPQSPGNLQSLEPCRPQPPGEPQPQGLYHSQPPAVLPYVLNVSKGALDRWIEERFQEIVGRVKASGIAIGNLGWIRRFQQAGIKVYGDYGLNVYNRQSQMAFEEQGVELLAPSHEANMFFCGNIPLMITEHPVSATELTDRKGEKYTILRWHSGDKYLLFQKEPRRQISAGKTGKQREFAGKAAIIPQIDYKE